MKILIKFREALQKKPNRGKSDEQLRGGGFSDSGSQQVAPPSFFSAYSAGMRFESL